MVYELAALGAAVCWAASSLLAADTAKQIGGLAFTRLRVGFAAIMLIGITLPLGLLSDIPTSAYPQLVLSGVIGLAVGDGALFIAFKRLGPRRAQILYTSNAPFAVLLGMFFLNEQPGLNDILGMVIVLAGVVIAITWGKRRSQMHNWESIEGALWIGILFGLLSGFGQALGTLIVKPVLDAGVNPMGALTIRMIAAFVLLLAVSPMLPKQAMKTTGKHALYALSNAFLAIVVGVGLLMYAFSIGDIGIASVLSATTPVLVLPLIWMKTRERPAAMAWIGALITVAGLALIATS